MSQLLPLLGRIKTTQTIKKTTNAMRLIAMSTHTKLGQLKASTRLYRQEIERLQKEITSLGENIIQKKVIIDHKVKKKLLIIIGSQKGLCGNFNLNIAQYFKTQFYQTYSKTNNIDIIIIGRQLYELFIHDKSDKIYKSNIFLAIKEFNWNNSSVIAQQISDFVLSDTYEAVTLYYTYPKTFFLQKHEQKMIWKNQFILEKNNIIEQEQFDWEQSYQETFNMIGNLALKAQIEEILLNSLLAEASSRFISMDAATRNAQDMIDTMMLDYNKLRQALITRELTDLSGGFVIN